MKDETYNLIIEELKTLTDELEAKVPDQYSTYTHSLIAFAEDLKAMMDFPTSSGIQLVQSTAKTLGDHDRITYELRNRVWKLCKDVASEYRNQLLVQQLFSMDTVAKPKTAKRTNSTTTITQE